MKEFLNKNLVTRIEAEANKNPKFGTQIYELKRLDTDINELEAKIAEREKLTDNINDLIAFREEYELVELLILLKEKRYKIIHEGNSRVTISENEEVDKIEQESYKINVEKSDSIISQIDNLMFKILQIKTNPPETSSEQKEKNLEIKKILKEIDILTRVN
ncbi:MAG: hypothetical protein WCW54_00040 [Candidatus Paceibacterota bacterium]